MVRTLLEITCFLDNTAYKKNSSKAPAKNLSIMSFLASKKTLQDSSTLTTSSQFNRANLELKKSSLGNCDSNRQGIFKQPVASQISNLKSIEPRPCSRLQDLVKSHLERQPGEPESYCMTKCKHALRKKYGVKGYIVDLVSLQLRSEYK